MGRKPIAPSQRAQPISFSLKPHLIAKIDNYAGDLRFSRSKFLMQAVTEYMTRNIVNPNDMEFSSNINDMSLTRRVAVGLAALQEANREGELISKAVMDALRRELNTADAKHIIADANLSTSSTEQRIDEADITFKRVESGLYHIYNHGTEVGHIKRDTNFKRKWIVVDDDGTSSHMTLQDAKEAVLEEWG